MENDTLSTVPPAPPPPIAVPNRGVDRRLYGIFDDKPVSPPPSVDASGPASLDLSLHKYKPSAHDRSFGPESNRPVGLLKEAFAPVKGGGPDVQISATSPSGALRPPTPAEATLPPDRQPRGTLNLNQGKENTPLPPSYADQARLQAQSSLPNSGPAPHIPRPQDGPPQATCPQRASFGLLAAGVARAVLAPEFNTTVAIGSRAPEPPRGGWNYRVSIGRDRASVSASLTF